MPATKSAIAPELVYGLKRGEDAALEQLFRLRSDALRQTAIGELEDASSASRVVEQVFVALWKARTTMESPGDVDAYLDRTLREAVVRERRRIAAVHRFEETEHVHLDSRRVATPSAEVQWDHIQGAIHAPPPDADRTARLLAEQSRHSAAVHVEEIGTRSNWKSALIVGGIAVAIAAGLIWSLDRASAGVQVDAAFASPDLRTLTTRSGQRGAVELRDGGSAALGPRSVLQIPPGYGGEFSVVKVQGAVQLRAAEASSRPIEARLATGPVAVVGTSFSVSAYPNDDQVMIRADDADAEVRLPSGTVTVPRGQALAVRDGATRRPGEADIEEVFAWTSGQFVVHDRPLREALVALALAYGTDITVPDESLLERPVSARAPLTSSRDAIEELERSGTIAFGYEGEQMVFRDAAALARSGRRR